MRRFAPLHNGQADEENPYWISFSDIMAGFLVIFILVSLALIYELTKIETNVSKAIKDLKLAEQARRDILHEVEVELKKKGIHVEISDNETVLRIPENILSFRQNQHQFPLDGQVADKVLAIGKTLYTAIIHGNRWKHLDTIFVEGHTDPFITKKYEGGNWELSTRRAVFVWKYWEEHLSEGSRLSEIKNHGQNLLFSVSGYGGTRQLDRIKDETGIEFRQRLRRIDIRITVRKPEIEEYEDIVENISEKVGEN